MKLPILIMILGALPGGAVHAATVDLSAMKRRPFTIDFQKGTVPSDQERQTKIRKIVEQFLAGPNDIGTHAKISYMLWPISGDEKYAYAFTFYAYGKKVNSICQAVTDSQLESYGATCTRAADQ